MVLMISDSDYKRVCWASRRGMLELDLILVPFVKNRFLELSPENQQRYVTLMEGDDTDMFSWFLKRVKPSDPEIAAIVEEILSYTKSIE
jgi:antitoxin CptB